MKISKRFMYFSNFMFKDENLLDYSNLFSSNKYDRWKYRFKLSSMKNYLMSKKQKSSYGFKLH